MALFYNQTELQSIGDIQRAVISVEKGSDVTISCLVLPQFPENYGIHWSSQSDNPINACWNIEHTSYDLKIQSANENHAGIYHCTVEIIINEQEMIRKASVEIKGNNYIHLMHTYDEFSLMPQSLNMKHPIFFY